MLRHLLGPLPPWAEQDHPVLRTLLAGQTPSTRRGRVLGALNLLLPVLGLLVLSVALTTNIFRTPPGQNASEIVARVLFWPTLVVQGVLALFALSYTISTVNAHQRQRTWDLLRVSEQGAQLTVQTRWAGVFWRLRNGLALVLLARAVLLALALYDITAFQGRYLDLLIGEAAPGTPVWAAVLSVALTFTAALLLPITGVALVAALGVWLGVRVRGQVGVVLVQVLFLLAAVGAGVALMRATLDFAAGAGLSAATAWSMALLTGGVADWGITLLHMDYLAVLWLRLPQGLLLGPALVGVMLLQAALAGLLLRAAGRAAQRRDAA